MVSVTYGQSGLDLDFDADGSVDQHFAACTDVPADPGRTKVVGLCGAYSALDQTFVPCQDGVF